MGGRGGEEGGGGGGRKIGREKGGREGVMVGDKEKLQTMGNNSSGVSQ